MSPKSTIHALDWTPSSVSFIWREERFECALEPAETCVEAALKAISRKTGCLMLEATAASSPDHSTESGELSLSYSVGLSWDGLLDSDDVGKLVIPLTLTTEAIDAAARMWSKLLTKKPRSVGNYLILTYDAGGFDLEEHFLDESPTEMLAS